MSNERKTIKIFIKKTLPTDQRRQVLRTVLRSGRRED
jgi:hypothetical protein